MFRRLRGWLGERVEDSLDRRSVRRRAFETVTWEEFKRMLDELEESGPADT